MTTKVKILIIEDDLYSRELYTEVLIDAGYDVTTSVDGEDGLKKAKIGGFDMIILDVMLPKIDGLTIIKTLYENPPKNPNKKIILFTNLAQDKVVLEAKKMDIEYCLPKTDYNPGQLVAKIGQILSK